MSEFQNNLGQPIGFPLPTWVAPQHPPHAPLEGRFCRLEPLQSSRHASDLFAANSLDTEQRMWTYLAYGPFDTLEAYTDWMDKLTGKPDPLFYAISDQATQKAVGVASYLRIDPASGSIEVGHVAYSPLLQRSPLATETMYLLMKHVFELGYRRYEWKCDALNGPSRSAAKRLGFSFEGVFRQATSYKGRNRDTAWFSIIDSEWPAQKEKFERWLDPANFDEQGIQRKRLGEA